MKVTKIIFMANRPMVKALIVLVLVVGLGLTFDLPVEAQTQRRQQQLRNPPEAIYGLVKDEKDQPFYLNPFPMQISILHNSVYDNPFPVNPPRHDQQDPPGEVYNYVLNPPRQRHLGSRQHRYEIFISSETPVPFYRPMLAFFTINGSTISGDGKRLEDFTSTSTYYYRFKANDLFLCKDFRSIVPALTVTSLAGYKYRFEFVGCGDAQAARKIIDQAQKDQFFNYIAEILDDFQGRVGRLPDRLIETVKFVPFGASGNTGGQEGYINLAFSHLKNTDRHVISHTIAHELFHKLPSSWSDTWRALALRASILKVCLDVYDNLSLDEGYSCSSILEFPAVWGEQYLMHRPVLVKFLTDPGLTSEQKKIIKEILDYLKTIVRDAP